MPKKGYKALNISEESFEKFLSLAQKYNLKNVDLFDEALKAFEEKKNNHPDFFGHIKCIPNPNLKRPVF